MRIVQPSPHRRSQVKLHLRMGYMQSPWTCSDLSFRTHLAHPFTHGRKTVYMFATRQVERPCVAAGFNLFQECDKSFTRSDALAKHMRLQHNMPPPPSGRGGSRKRKRGDSPQPSTPSAAPTEPPSAFNTFKVEPRSPSEAGAPGGDYFENATPEEQVDDVLEDDDDDDGIPPHLARLVDPQTGLILGRPPALVKYVIQKAKWRYALETHAALIEELRCVDSMSRDPRGLI